MPKLTLQGAPPLPSWQSADKVGMWTVDINLDVRVLASSIPGIVLRASNKCLTLDVDCRPCIPGHVKLSGVLSLHETGAVFAPSREVPDGLSKAEYWKKMSMREPPRLLAPKLVRGPCYADTRPSEFNEPSVRALAQLCLAERLSSAVELDMTCQMAGLECTHRDSMTDCRCPAQV